MKFLKKVLVLTLLLVGSQTFGQDPHKDSGLMKGIVQEVQQVSSYTYLYVLEEDGTKRWLAVPNIEAKLGDIYYYKGGMVMPNFKSTELNKTFDSVVFLSNVTNADVIDTEKGLVDPNAPLTEVKEAKQATLEQLELSVETIEGGIRIGELFENKQLYAEKKIKIKGEVTKFSMAIMGKNWVHFQDGTSHEGAYDLMITTQENVQVGDVVVFEGVISLDKDFGAGYFYAVVLEEAVLEGK